MFNKSSIPTPISLEMRQNIMPSEVVAIQTDANSATIILKLEITHEQAADIVIECVEAGKVSNYTVTSQDENGCITGFDAMMMA